MTTPKPSNRAGRRQSTNPRSDASILADLFSERSDLTTIATRHAMSLTLLASWAARPRIVGALAALIRLADDRADLALARARTDAAHAMRHLATPDSDSDLARKAALDLLKLPRKPPHIPLPNHPHSTPEATNPQIAIDHDAIRSLLEHAGAQSDPNSPHPQSSTEDSQS